MYGVHILTADRQEPLLAHHQVVSLFSSIAYELPSNTDGSPTPWDLRGLVLEGESEPVAASVVERWLDAVYHFSRIDASRRPQLPSTLAEARPLLLLADAVGTAQGLMDSLGGALADQPDLALTLAVGELKVDLRLKGGLHYIAGGALFYLPVGEFKCGKTSLVGKEAFEPHAAAFPSAVAREVESWLHLAGRLNLVPLARALVGFVKAELMPTNLSILQPAFASVFSPRVLQFMPRELLLEGFARDAVMERPAQAVLVNKEVQLIPVAPLSATWFLTPCDGTVNVVASRVKKSTLVAAGGNFIPATVTLGGPSHEECTKLVEEVVAAALEED
ncbi:hypothetical protein HYH03_007665 [Edaphochlamys debaryana]|uniref:Uncharacterized protein n=1 Tax=Edaphochlamys debaryana TaxID=47281 RepID=A0A835Y0B6_9CHLO|nr:hypothetical protein HYH03_007665 [Edaphochlamys debaryana]|eukprot:KAG2494312.1 hypothetical protein HYH03_007665 [Edaphochlamys debaryana]